MFPTRSDDPDLIDRLLATNSDFRRLMEARRKEADGGKVRPLAAVRQNFTEDNCSDNAPPTQESPNTP